MQLFEGQSDLLGSYFHHLKGLTHTPIRFIKLQHKNEVLTCRNVLLYLCDIRRWVCIQTAMTAQKHRTGWMAGLIRPLAHLSDSAVPTYLFSCFAGNIVALQMILQPNTRLSNAPW